MEEEGTNKTKSAASNFLTTIASTKGKLEHYIKLARCQKTFQKTVFKIQFNTHPELQEVQTLFLKHLTANESAEHKMATAPKGPRERRLEQFLNKTGWEGDDMEEEDNED